MVDDGPQLGLGRIDVAALPAVGVNQVGGGGPALVDAEVTVDQEGDGVLGIQLKIKIKRFLIVFTIRKRT